MVKANIIKDDDHEDDLWYSALTANAVWSGEKEKKGKVKDTLEKWARASLDMPN